MPKKIAVIGLGNTLRRDDGIGIKILESLLKFYKRDSVDYLNFGIASFDLLHRIQDYDTCVLIDGINAGLKPGELKISALKDIVYKIKSPGLSTHEFSLKGIFELHQKLKLKGRIFVAGVQIKEASFQEGLSPQLESTLEKNTRAIAVFIDKIK